MKNLFTILGCCLFSAAAFAYAGPKASNGNAPEARRSKAGGQMVLICHKGREMSVDVHAVAAHVAHGDKVGSCTSTPPGDFDPNNPVRTVKGQ